MRKALVCLFTADTAQALWRWLLLVLIFAISWLALSPNPPQVMSTGWDKSNHMLAFGTLAFCGHWGWRQRIERELWLPLALLGFGGVIELLQLHVPGRSGEWADMLADSVGILAGMLMAKLALILLCRIQAGPDKR